MKCEGCYENIDAKFGFAIKNNQCPACGNKIMSSENMAGFIGLKSFLSNILDGVDINSLASILVENFEIKQKLENSSVNKIKAKIKSTKIIEEQNTEQVLEDEDLDEDDLKMLQQPTDKAEVKKIINQLKSLREEALNGSLSDNETQVEADIRAKLENSREAVLNGSGGFRR